jgi:hypothetical protein
MMSCKTLISSPSPGKMTAISDRSIWGKILMPITFSIKAKSNVTLLLLREGSSQFKCLLEMINSRMRVPEHVLQYM